jgi:hypothetical protein
VGVGDRGRGRDHDRVLYVPADRDDLLGRKPSGSGRGGQDPRIAARHDDPAVAPGHPVRPRGPRPFLAGAAARAALRVARARDAACLARTRLSPRPGAAPPRGA